MGERCKLPQWVRAEPGNQTIFGVFWVEKMLLVRAVLSAYLWEKNPKI